MRRFLEQKELKKTLHKFLHRCDLSLEAVLGMQRRLGCIHYDTFKLPGAGSAQKRHHVDYQEQDQ